MKIDIAVFTETIKKGNGIEKLSDYIFFYSGIPKSNRACADISILTNKKYKNKVKNWGGYKWTTSYSKFNISWTSSIHRRAYGPSEDAPQEEKNEFYDELDDTLTYLGKKRTIIILLGNLNARVRSSENNKVVGK